MRETMNVKDAQLRLEQLMEGHLPPGKRLFWRIRCMPGPMKVS